MVAQNRVGVDMISHNSTCDLETVMDGLGSECTEPGQGRAADKYDHVGRVKVEVKCCQTAPKAMG